MYNSRFQLFCQKTRLFNEFLLSYVYREANNRSDLVILNAQHVDDEPLAIVQLPHRVPFGFHGCWVDESTKRVS